MPAFIFLLAVISLGIYSYTQIDLNLTLTSNELFLGFQKWAIGLGYFNRGISGGIFVAIVIALFAGYLALIFQRSVLIKYWKVILLVVLGIGLISYSAFSHDFFNYIFDAKILVHYHENPYLQKALDYPQDPWIRFMQWTHRTYPYGPMWLGISMMPVALGMDKFVLTAVLFKTMFAAFYLGNGLLIFRILTKVKSKIAILSSLAYLFNPLVIIESLISPHLDSAMTFFMLLSIFLFLQNRKALSAVSILASLGVKFVTGVMALPLLFPKISYNRLITMSIILVSLATFGAAIYREPYPWYFLPVLALMALRCENTSYQIVSVAISAGLISRYLPYLYSGEYSVLAANLLLASISLCVFLFLSILWRKYETTN